VPAEPTLQSKIALLPFHDFQAHRLESMYADMLLRFAIEAVHVICITVFSKGFELDAEIAVTETGHAESP
jgi:hypothetical protein